MTGQHDVEERGGSSAGHNNRGPMLAGHSTVRYNETVMQVAISEEIASLRTLRVDTNGAQLEVRDRGEGEPVVFIHGSMPDECAAVVKEPALVKHFRVIDYHRRGWGSSSRAVGPVSIGQGVEDCREILRHLRVERAHFAGQSSGGAVVLQLALDAPDLVNTVAVLEPFIASVVMGSSPMLEEMMAKAGSMYATGDRAGAVGVFALAVAGDGFRETFDRTLPPGYFERWVEAADTIFQNDAPGVMSWSFSAAEAARITQPFLNVTAASTRTHLGVVYSALRSWVPHAENVELPNATHCMLQSNPKGTAELLADFVARHPLHA
jgi:pimeloyl-ACP methyl ester carboxylesterase